MKICNSEAMKQIKMFEDELAKLRDNEEMNNTVSYKEGEKKVEVNYDYTKTRQEVARINAEIRKIKKALAIANSTFLIDDFNITIGEALIYLAQLNREYYKLSDLVNRNKISRRITPNGVIEYTECTYDPEQAKLDQKEIFSTINKLQVAIDRANLTCFIEI